VSSNRNTKLTKLTKVSQGQIFSSGKLFFVPFAFFV